MASARHVRFAAAGSAAVLGVALLGACTSDPPGPTAAANALAEALESGDFSDVDFTVPSDATTASRTRTSTFEGLGDREPRVTVKSVAVDKGDAKAATATIAYAKPTPAPTWTATPKPTVQAKPKARPPAPRVGAVMGGGGGESAEAPSVAGGGPTATPTPTATPLPVETPVPTPPAG